LRASGFESIHAGDIDFLHNNWITDDELARIAKLELLDEVEEFQLLAKHYCLVCGERRQSIWQSYKWQ